MGHGDAVGVLSLALLSARPLRESVSPAPAHLELHSAHLLVSLHQLLGDAHGKAH